MVNRTDLILSKFGLQTRRSAADFIVPALGVFGAGAIVGAGVALMFAPKPGKELRGDIGGGLRTAGTGAKNLGTSVGAGIRGGYQRIRSVIPGNGGASQDLSEMSRDELYEKAQELEIPGRSNMSREELLDAVQAS